MHVSDITTKQFGYLTAIRPTAKRRNHCIVWECLCRCGNTHFVTTAILASGNIRSCGCVRKEGRPSARLSLTGQRFGRLTAIRITASRKHGSVIWECVCDCGNLYHARAALLNSGGVTNCGCQKKRFRHGLCGTRIYRVWAGMMQRCYNSNQSEFHNYGGRGIKVCDEWHDAAIFARDVGDPPKGAYSLDRYPDKNGDYKPGNVRWATPTEQSRNTRRNKPITAFGETRFAADWVPFRNIPIWTIRSRIYAGWKEEHAVSLPIGHRLYKNRING